MNLVFYIDKTFEHEFTSNNLIKSDMVIDRNQRRGKIQAYRELMGDRDQYKLKSQQTHLQFTNQRCEMPAPVVVYADFESAIDDRNKHKPIMLSCLAVSRIPAIDT